MDIKEEGLRWVHGSLIACIVFFGGECYTNVALWPSRFLPLSFDRCIFAKTSDSFHNIHQDDFAFAAKSIPINSANIVYLHLDKIREKVGAL